MFRDTPSRSRYSIWKPLSTISESPWSNCWFKNPQRSTISLSEMLPVHNWLTKVTTPLGAIPTRPLKVTWFLYALNISEFNNNLYGIWHLTFVQSIITLVEGYFSLKSAGMVLIITSFEGQKLICPNFRYMKFSQVLKILLTADWEIPYKCPRCFSLKPCFSLHKTINNSSLGVNAGFESPLTLLWVSSTSLSLSVTLS